MSFLDRIAECNVFDPARVRPFVVAGAPVGLIRNDFVTRLEGFPDVLEVTPERVTLRPEFGDFASRSAALDRVLRVLAGEGRLNGWRDEAYPVRTGPAAAPLLQIERAGVPYFGVRAHGVHMNGYVRKPDGLHMWIGRRSRDKPTYPGMLDNTVAGGQPIGIGLLDNLVKECQEEADIPAEIARQARPVGCITYCLEAADGVKPDVQFCFDLELPADFTPRNTDGEIAEFYLWPIARVAETVRDTRDFKFNCNLVIIDFLVRHGFIPPEHPDYIAIAQGLRR